MHKSRNNHDDSRCEHAALIEGIDGKLSNVCHYYSCGHSSLYIYTLGVEVCAVSANLGTTLEAWPGEVQTITAIMSAKPLMLIHCTLNNII